MKKTSILLCIAVSMITTGCLKSIDELGISTHTTYTGHVVDKTTHLRISNATVQIGFSWENSQGIQISDYILAKTNTDANGDFRLDLDYKTLDGQVDLIVLNGDQYEAAAFTLLGAGKAEYDYGTIELKKK